jgi:hypothetical protein
MINGAHAILYSREPEKDKAFLRDVLKLSHVDIGHGWLIFALPPAEVAVHPADGDEKHELYLMTDDVAALVATLRQQSVKCSEPTTMRWGVLTQVTLPGGGTLGIYQPRHARPDPES